MEQREGELVYLKLDMDGADGKALSSQGILAGTEYEYYKPFDDAPEYEEYKEVPKWLKVVAGVAVAAVVGLAVGALVVVTGGLAAAALGVTAVQFGMTAHCIPSVTSQHPSRLPPLPGFRLLWDTASPPSLSPCFPFYTVRFSAPRQGKSPVHGK